MGANGFVYETMIRVMKEPRTSFEYWVLTGSVLPLPAGHQSLRAKGLRKEPQ